MTKELKSWLPTFSNVFLLSIFIIFVLFNMNISRMLPIYPDEVAYKIFLGQFFVNGGLKQSVTPYCYEGFLVSSPILLQPAAHLWSLIHCLGGSWFSYRIIPIVCLCLVYCYLILNFLHTKKRIILVFSCLPLFGPILYGLTILRPEIIIIFFAILMHIVANKIISLTKTMLYLFSLLVGVI